MSTTLLIFLDDCPRTRSFLKKGYCVETKCFYHDKTITESSRMKVRCSHPQIFINEKERDLRRVMMKMLEEIIATKNIIQVPVKKSSIGNK